MSFLSQVNQKIDNTKDQEYLMRENEWHIYNDN